MTSEDLEPRYKVGDWVQATNDRSFVGEVIKEPTQYGGGYWYEVQSKTHQKRTLMEAALELHTPNPDPVDRFISSSFGSPTDLVQLLTFQRLEEPVDTTLYSLGGSRIDFYPHQYKPLVRFLSSSNNRLILADEVGLGKTIEAGLILIEQRARRAAGRVLIVSPASLTEKWRREMWERFDEEFEIFRSTEFRRTLERWEDQGPPHRFRGIISLNGLRTSKTLKHLGEAPPPFDLVIFDEAHHLRNPRTKSHQAARAVIPHSHAALLLTATPIQLGNENLFHLLSLLEPGEFEKFEVFQQRLAANEPIVRAGRLIRAGQQTDLLKVKETLLTARAMEPEYFEHNPLFQRVLKQIGTRNELTHREAAEMQEDLNELNLLSRHVTRSVRRDVFPDAPVRKARIFSAPMTPAEVEFYAACTAFARSQYQGEGGFAHLLAANRQRQAASCMQAAKDQFASQARDALDPEQTDLLDDLDSGSDSDVPPEHLPPSKRMLRAAESLGPIDSKFDALLEALRAIDEEEPASKVIIFCYFKKTLRYLEERLGKEGYPAVRIDGDVPSDPNDPDKDERRKRMNRFKDPQSGIRLLLSSEVGSEGLDFQFCHFLINYDLPWNPMKLEQRIGRIDRLGQEAKRIHILNLSLKGTIEDRILHRLHERIGIFKRSIGDLESIVGEEIGTLSRDLLSQQLSPQEEERRIDQAAQAIEAQKKELEKLEEESEQFLGKDHLFSQRLKDAEQGGHSLAPQDIEGLLRRFLDLTHPEVELEPVGKGVFHLTPTWQFEEAVRNLPGDQLQRRFLSRLGRSPVRCTFESKRAFHDHELEFLGPHHPAIRLAVEFFRNNQHTLFPAFSLRIPAMEDLAEGIYAFGLVKRTERMEETRHFVEILILDCDSMTPLEKDLSDRILGAMLRKSTSWACPPPPEETARALIDKVKEGLVRRVAAILEHRKERMQARIQTQLESLRRTHEVRRRRIKSQIQTLIDRGRGESVIRATQGQLEAEDKRFEARKQRLESGLEVQASFSLFGCGLVLVGEEDPERDQ